MQSPPEMAGEEALFIEQNHDIQGNVSSTVMHSTATSNYVAPGLVYLPQAGSDVLADNQEGLDVEGTRGMFEKQQEGKTTRVINIGAIVALLLSMLLWFVIEAAWVMQAPNDAWRTGASVAGSMVAILGVLSITFAVRLHSGRPSTFLKVVVHSGNGVILCGIVVWAIGKYALLLGEEVDEEINYRPMFVTGQVIGVFFLECALWHAMGGFMHEWRTWPAASSLLAQLGLVVFFAFAGAVGSLQIVYGYSSAGLTVRRIGGGCVAGAALMLAILSGVMCASSYRFAKSVAVFSGMGVNGVIVYAIGQGMYMNDLWMVYPLAIKTMFGGELVTAILFVFAGMLITVAALRTPLEALQTKTSVPKVHMIEGKPYIIRNGVPVACQVQGGGGGGGMPNQMQQGNQMSMATEQEGKTTRVINICAIVALLLSMLLWFVIEAAWVLEAPDLSDWSFQASVAGSMVAILGVLSLMATFAVRLHSGKTSTFLKVLAHSGNGVILCGIVVWAIGKECLFQFEDASGDSDRAVFVTGQVIGVFFLECALWLAVGGFVHEWRTWPAASSLLAQLGLVMFFLLAGAVGGLGLDWYDDSSPGLSVRRIGGGCVAGAALMLAILSGVMCASSYRFAKSVAVFSGMGVNGVFVYALGQWMYVNDFWENNALAVKTMFGGELATAILFVFAGMLITVAALRTPLEALQTRSEERQVERGGGGGGGMPNQVLPQGEEPNQAVLQQEKSLQQQTMLHQQMQLQTQMQMQQQQQQIQMQLQQLQQQMQMQQQQQQYVTQQPYPSPQQQRQVKTMAPPGPRAASQSHSSPGGVVVEGPTDGASAGIAQQYHSYVLME